MLVTTTGELAVPPTVDQEEEVRLTAATLKYLEELTTNAVRRGIDEAMTKENARKFWSAGFEVMQEQAAEHTGRFVIGGVWGIFRKSAIFLLLGGVVYAVGGWSALAGFFKALFSSGA